MKQTIVYRVERGGGVGPYNRRYYSKWKLDEDWSLDNNPTLGLSFSSKDVKKILEQEWRCGFKCKADLKKWFTKEELKRLYNLGFKVSRIEVKRIVVGYKQVVFKGRKSVQRLGLREVL